MLLTILSIHGSSFAHNFAEGGGIYNQSGTPFDELESNIIADNVAISNPDFAGIVTAASYNLIGINQGQNVEHA